MEKEERFPKYSEELVQRLREWMEEGRYVRYRRYTRSLDEFIIEQGYFIILKLLELDEKVDLLLAQAHSRRKEIKTKKAKSPWQ